MKCPCIQTKDTRTISLSGEGTIYDPLFANVKVSAVADNCLVTKPDGLYVRCSTGGGTSPSQPQPPELPQDGEPFQLLQMGNKGPEWGVVGSLGPTGQFVGPWDPLRVYEQGDIIHGKYQTSDLPDPRNMFLRANQSGPLPEPDASNAGSSGPVWFTHTASGGLELELGFDAEATGFQSAAAGPGAVANKDNATAFGPLAEASGFLSCAFGFMALADAQSSAAYGPGAWAKGSGSTAFGAAAEAKGQESVAWGAQAKATHDSSGAINTESTADDRLTVGFDELEVGKASESGFTSLVLRDKSGQKWRIIVNTDGTLNVSSL